MKQKSLMSFFGGKNAGGVNQNGPGKSSSTSTQTPKGIATPAPQANSGIRKRVSSIIQEPKTPESKPRDQKELMSSVSPRTDSYGDVPPSSDAIDVDMTSSDEELRAARPEPRVSHPFKTG